MKKSISFLLVIVLLIGMVTTAFAVGSPVVSMKADKDTVHAGETVTVNLSIDTEVSNLMAFQFNLYYDDAKFTKTSATVGEAYAQTVVGEKCKDSKGAYLPISGLDTLGQPIVLKKGTVATVVFTANKGVTAKDVKFELSVDAMADYDTFQNVAVKAPEKVNVSIAVSREHTEQHTEEKHEGKAATCAEVGYEAYVTCKDCDYTTYKEIPAKGHTEVVDKAVEATCTTAGKTEGKHCTVCSTVTVPQTAVPVKSHNFSNGTCTACGAADPNYNTTPQVTGVTRLYGANRYETAFKAADELKTLRGGKQFDSVIIACGTNFADALAGSYLAAVKDAPILLVQPNMVKKVTNYIKTNLRAGGTVYILGGKNAVPESMEAGLGGFNVKRFAGANRYETNLMILKEAGVGDQEILVATGTNFADSLSASATGKPILLVGAKLTSAQKQFLNGTTGTKYILGGTNAVSANIENELKAYGAVQRLGGANRYATSTLIAETFFKAPKAAVLSYAQNFPDGLCGGVIAYKQGAPMLLVTNGNGAKAADAYTAKLGIKGGYVLGGPGLISDKTADQLLK